MGTAGSATQATACSPRCKVPTRPHTHAHTRTHTRTHMHTHTHTAKDQGRAWAGGNKQCQRRLTDVDTVALAEKEGVTLYVAEKEMVGVTLADKEVLLVTELTVEVDTEGVAEVLLWG